MRDVSRFFSDRLPTLREPNALGRSLHEARASGRPLINFSESNPTKVGASLPAREVLSALALPGCLAYDPDPRGLPATRSAVADWYKGAGILVDPKDIFLSASTSEAYGWLFKLLADPGDAVLVPKPGYPLFEYLAALEGVRSVPYRLEYLHPRGWRIDMDQLEYLLRSQRPKAVVLIHPNNPTGSYVDSSERARLKELCASFDAALIVDEVFLSYALEAGPEPSFAGEPETPCFVLNGLSKLLGLPQMKLGWIVQGGTPGFKASAASRLEIIADTYLSVGAPIAQAAPLLLPKAQAFAGGLRERLSRNLGVLRAVLEGEGSPYRVLRCSAGWSAVVEVPRVIPEEEMALGLLNEEGVYLHPGYLFDFEREAYFSVSLLLSPQEFLEAAGRLKRYLDRTIQ